MLYYCEIKECTKAYSTASSLNRHKRVRHPGFTMRGRASPIECAKIIRSTILPSEVNYLTMYNSFYKTKSMMEAGVYELNKKKIALGIEATNIRNMQSPLKTKLDKILKSSKVGDVLMYGGNGKDKKCVHIINAYYSNSLYNEQVEWSCERELPGGYPSSEFHIMNYRGEELLNADGVKYIPMNLQPTNKHRFPKDPEKYFSELGKYSFGKSEGTFNNIRSRIAMMPYQFLNTLKDPFVYFNIYKQIYEKPIIYGVLTAESEFLKEYNITKKIFTKFTWDNYMATNPNYKSKWDMPKISTGELSSLNKIWNIFSEKFFDNSPWYSMIAIFTLQRPEKFVIVFEEPFEERHSNDEFYQQYRVEVNISDKLRPFIVGGSEYRTHRPDE
jgi:hypothetical protein